MKPMSSCYWSEIVHDAVVLMAGALESVPPVPWTVSCIGKTIVHSHNVWSFTLALSSEGRVVQMKQTPSAEMQSTLCTRNRVSPDPWQDSCTNCPLLRAFLLALLALPPGPKSLLLETLVHTSLSLLLSSFESPPQEDPQFLVYLMQTPKALPYLPYPSHVS